MDYPLPTGLQANKHCLPVLVCITQLDHTWCFPTLSSGTSFLLPGSQDPVPPLFFFPFFFLPQSLSLPSFSLTIPQHCCPSLINSRALTCISLVSPRWYHGHLSGSAAESLLQAKATPWTFLVRESLSKPGDFVLSVLTDQLKPGSDAPPAGATSAAGARLKVTHIKIMCEVSSWESKRKGNARGLC